MVPKVSDEHKLAVRERILDAAEKLFSRKGYYDTSMDEIVSESGFSKGAIYGYFRSKEDLFLALQEKQQASGFEEIKSMFSPKETARSKLEKLLEIVFASQAECSKEECRIIFEFWVTAPRIKSLQGRMDSRYMKNRSFLASIIEEGVKNGEFREDLDVDSLASFLMAALDGLSFHWTLSDQDFDWKKLKNIFNKILIRLLIKNGEKKDIQTNISASEEQQK
jgi:AcrR family transcriptional regulator